MKTTTLAMLGLLMVGLVAGSVAAYGGPFQDNIQDDNIHSAIAAGDYDAWAQAMENRITEDNFERHLERFREGKNNEFKRGDRPNDEGRMEMSGFIENGDYEGWSQKMMELHPGADLSEDDFNTLVEMHDARASGDMDAWQDLRNSLDLPMPRRGRFMN